ncbi:MAG: M23/M56 family metallopeptidase [Bacteroidota bacterium]
MSSVLIYILQVNLVFGSFYLLYKVVFSRFTFHAFNRMFLLLLLPLALLLPLSGSIFPEMQFPLEIPLLEDFAPFSTLIVDTNTTTETEQLQTINYSFWIFSLYVLGVVCFLWRFVQTTVKLFKLKQQSKEINVHNTKVYSAKVLEVFSYFQWIFVPTTNTASVNEYMLAHEKAHISKLHSADVVLAEIFIAFNWFNPLAYLYRKSLKSIHEFQADALVLRQENIKKSSYLALLLQSLEPTQINPAYNYFSHPTLKKRIEMITKSQSKKRLKLVYMLLIPLVGIAFMAFRSPETMVDIPDEIVPTVFVQENGIPSLFPVQNKTAKHISSRFGVMRKHPKLKNKTKHGGIDIKAPKGTPVVATANGMVLQAKEEGNWGNLIVIAHLEGFETWYAHLEGFNTKLGATVQKGEIIGYVGSTGFSTAPHLHYEVRHHGKRVNPLNYMTENAQE